MMAVRWRGLVLPGVLSVVGVAVLVSLGTWQLSRKAWKDGLVAGVEAGIRSPPRPIGAAMGADRDAPAGAEYLPVTARGRFDHARELHVFTHIDKPKGAVGGVGYWIVTPFALADGGTVLVNRGFVPIDRKDPATRAAGRVEGEVEIRGLTRRPEPRLWFDNPDDTVRNIWYVRDPAVMGRHLGIRVATGLLVDQTAPVPPGGLPQPGETRLSFKNDHLGYALTWYGLALALIGVFFAFARSRLRAPVA